MKKDKVNVQALEVALGKKQHLETGKVYAVTQEVAEALVMGDKAIEAKDSMKVGKVYALPKKSPNITD